MRNEKGLWKEENKKKVRVNKGIQFGRTNGNYAAHDPANEQPP